ncbi:MAG: thioredoxin family protein [Verrucomicrobiae bacterium]|nr:thioredoxin family protein [Verrucomicrobiae bacterium]
MLAFRPLIISIASALCLPTAVRAEPSSAPTFAAAQAKAKSEQRLLFLLFKSSDCKHCRKFDENVFSTPVFQDFARQHLSLMVYDVDAYAALSEDERELALSLEEKYDVDKMPAIVVYAPDGKELLRTQGYRGTEAEKIVAQLKTMLP